jgi:formate hydrogenlyase subunit 3/multisubunit Na+/H+ antiporter MnhD subunit
MNENIVTIIGICLLIGAMAKSSQIGLHVWLPMAMEGLQINYFMKLYSTLLYSTLLYSTIRQAAKAIGCVRGTILLADKAFKQRKSSI